MEQRCHRADGIGAAAEPEQVDVISWLIRAHEEDIRVAHVVFEAIADGHTQNLGNLPGEGRECARRFHSPESGVVVRNLSAGIPDQHRIQLDDVGSILRELGRGSVAADDDVLRHPGPPDPLLSGGGRQTYIA
jgi:hypothetical protein